MFVWGADFAEMLMLAFFVVPFYYRICTFNLLYFYLYYVVRACMFTKAPWTILHINTYRFDEVPYRMWFGLYIKLNFLWKNCTHNLLGKYRRSNITMPTHTWLKQNNNNMQHIAHESKRINSHKTTSTQRNLCTCVLIERAKVRIFGHWNTIREIY